MDKSDQLSHQRQFNLFNQSDIDLHSDCVIIIQVYVNRKFLTKKKSHFFYKKDFCLFADFPFHQFYFYFDTSEGANGMRVDVSFTCTELEKS